MALNARLPRCDRRQSQAGDGLRSERIATPHARRRGPYLWLAAALIGLAIIAAPYVQGLLQPEFVADAPHCIGRADTALANTCDFAVNLTVCTPSETDTPDCRLYPLPPGATTARMAGEAAARVAFDTYACKAPFIPARRRNINNSSVWEDGCRNPT